jgi:glycosyltransferase involved in cell wall biosynthesis
VSEGQELAIKFGFKGKFLGYFPGGGGLSLKTIDRYCKKGSVSKRRIIIVKGRDYIDGDPIGRAMTIMKALLLCKHKLNGYQVIVIQAGKNITHEASKLKVKGINIICLSGLPYTKLLELMGKTKIFIADTINDGLPNTLVESISLGAFPIHSNLFSLQDWIKNRENGLLVDSGDIKKYAYSINMALSNDNFIDRASKINKKIVFSRLCSDVVKKKMIQIYKDIINENIIH